MPTRPQDPTEGDQQRHTTNHGRSHPGIALRTIPVVLRSLKDRRKVTVNALLDDGSTKTYINADVASQLGLTGQTQEVTIDVLNGQSESFKTMPVDFMVESCDGGIRQHISAYTVNKVTGDMQVINWAKHSSEWPHLHGIEFHRPKKVTVDILIGVDYANLHSSLKEVLGKPGQPMARLTPLGWTCIGGDSIRASSHFARTYFADDRLTQATERFWQVEEVAHSNIKVLTPEDSSVLDDTKKSLFKENGRYNVAIPWKPGAKEHLDDNYDMALKRLTNTEAHLKKDKRIEKSYIETIKRKAILEN